MVGVITSFDADDTRQIAAARALRLDVFCAEQGVPPALELDGRDHECIHFLMYDGGVAIATARMRPYENKGFKIERMAVTCSRRGSGAGRALMAHVLTTLRDMNVYTALLHAQVSAEPFYLRCGFKSEGDVYIEAGIPHRTMRLVLDP